MITSFLGHAQIREASFRALVPTAADFKWGIPPSEKAASLTLPFREGSP